jgi:hypothetical protein
MKKRVEYCVKCKKRTLHDCVAKETFADGMGAIRGLIAIVTLGMSEGYLASRHYRCNRCGNIIKK